MEHKRANELRAREVYERNQKLSESMILCGMNKRDIEYLGTEIHNIIRNHFGKELIDKIAEEYHKNG